MSPKKLVIGAGLAAALLPGGAVVASDYPPDAPPATTVLASSEGGGTSQGDPTPQALRRSAALAETGSDPGALVPVAAGAVVAGAGLVLVARRRRQLVS